MKYKFKILDESGKTIIPVYKTGTPAQHFVFCVSMCINLLNKESLYEIFKVLNRSEQEAKRAIIAKLLPGGKIDPFLMEEFRKTLRPLVAPESVVPVLFISYLHDHPGITPEIFLSQWGNKEIAEFKVLMDTSVDEKMRSTELFFKVLRKIRIPGLASCVVEIEQSISPLERANAILTVLKEERICSSNDEKGFSQQLKAIRVLTQKLADTQRILAPGLTACVASTLLKVGLGQELAQRFVLEYCIKYKEKNLALIFLGNPTDPRKNHVLIIVGKVVVPDNLVIGADGAQVEICPEKNNQKFLDFLQANKENVVVDPLLNCSGISHEGIATLKHCQKNGIDYVVGVRNYSQTPNLVENASAIKSNAAALAQTCAALLSLKLPSQSAAAAASPPSGDSKDEKGGFHSAVFSKPAALPQIDQKVLDRHSLKDTTSESLEKGLRSAASNNKLNDLKIFILHVKNIDAQDNNPEKKYTALHLAVMKGHVAIIKELLQNKARTDIQDAHHKTAASYADVSGIEAIKELFPKPTAAAMKP
jgi:hypothetical protein